MNEYEITKQLTRGGQGSTCEARDKRSNNHVVIKMVACDSINSGNNALQECKMLQSLSHPNIVGYLDFFIHQDPKTQELLVCTVMEFCKHGDLSKHLSAVKSSSKRLPEKTVLRWVEQILNALAYMHDKKILHRDVKPHNVFITGDGKMKMGDFGLASNTQRYKATSTVGRRATSRQKEEYGPPVDVWGVGCILYEIMTLDFLYDKKGMLCVQVLTRPFKPSDFTQDYSQEMRELTCAFLDKDPQRRPGCKQSVAIVLRVLGDTGGGLPSGFEAPSPRSRDGLNFLDEGSVSSRGPAAPSRSQQSLQKRTSSRERDGDSGGYLQQQLSERGLSARGVRLRKNVSLDEIAAELRAVGSLYRYMNVFEETRLCGKALANVEEEGNLASYVPISNVPDKQAVIKILRKLLTSPDTGGVLVGSSAAGGEVHDVNTVVGRWLKREGFGAYQGSFHRAGLTDLTSVANLTKTGVSSIIVEDAPHSQWERDIDLLCDSIGQLHVDLDKERRRPGSTDLGQLLGTRTKHFRTAGSATSRSNEEESPTNRMAGSSLRRSETLPSQPTPQRFSLAGFEKAEDMVDDGLVDLDSLMNPKKGGVPKRAATLSATPSGPKTINLRLIEIVNASLLMQSMFLVIVVARKTGEVLFTEDTIQLLPQPTERSLMRFHLDQSMRVPNDADAAVYFEVRHIKNGKPQPTKYWAMLSPGVKERGDCSLQMYKAPCIYDIRKQRCQPKQGSRFHLSVTPA
eukprot:CAMPEP_0206279270 /NCGR_PEP_ID=MMETSP0047_2-20121206/37936_1 /ASSEMBLY_ACC=CAM_ASM_000192 /TAXON_ID=195065 /ORGANISM="Chroomonas mesostigmatica_cf, Strain CCMP1168" /LENGTH=739 /DNA_ID=CAMNT_0053709215 /DNA_START=16 /DNA_END=2236 /DNA_ORIENTATION=+